MTSSIGQAVKFAREAQGITQGELAKRIGVSQPRVSAMERSESIPHLEQVSEVEKALGLAPGYILRAAGRIAPDGGEGSGIDLVEVSARLDDVIHAMEALGRSLGLRSDSSNRHEDARSKSRGGRKKKAAH